MQTEVGDPPSPDNEPEVATLVQQRGETREHLRAVIEEFETSDQELQSLNEETQGDRASDR